MTTIRRARPAEAPNLSALALKSKAYWGYDESFMVACRDELTLSADEVVENPTYVTEVNGQVVGFYALERLDENRIELNYLFVDPAFIGDGHGRALIEHAKQSARELGSSVLVIQGDPNAQHFYGAAGARQVGERASASIRGRTLPVFEILLS